MRSESFINGKWVKANASFPVHSPIDGRLIGQAPEVSADQLNEAIVTSNAAFPSWAERTGRERSTYIRRLFELQIKHGDTLARIISTEMGKPLTEARGEIAYGASFFEWFAEQAKRVHGELLNSPWPGRQVSYTREPIGPVAIITPVRVHVLSALFSVLHNSNRFLRPQISNYSGTFRMR
jgi:succinate-semialdehyde dehydrogenase/glutarate-semialdehyde dehydrogenase